MIPHLSNWTIVVVGKWNAEILTPEWVSEFVVKDEDFEIDLVLDGMTSNIRYKFKDIIYVPRSSRLIVSVTKPADEALHKAEQAVCRTLELLPVTPITALGVNITFLESEIPARLANIFQVSDVSYISDEGLEIYRSALTREIYFEDRILNMKISQTDHGVRLAMNYHLSVREPQKAVDALRGKFATYRMQAERLLNNLYGLIREDVDNA